MGRILIRSTLVEIVTGSRIEVRSYGPPPKQDLKLFPALVVQLTSVVYQFAE